MCAPTDGSKSLCSVSCHESGAITAASATLTATPAGRTPAYASAVLTLLPSGLAMAMQRPSSGGSTGVRVVPVPVASIGRLWMKNGQSAPMPAAISASRTVLSPRPKSSLSPIRVNAASAEPPPRPAPSGIIFRRKMLAAGMPSHSAASARHAFITRFFSGGHATGRPLVVSVVSRPCVAGTISSISHHPTGTITLSMSW